MFFQISCVYICVYKDIHIYIHRHVYMLNFCIYVSIHIYMYVYMQNFLHMYVCVCMCIPIHTDTYIHTHTVFRDHNSCITYLVHLKIYHKHHLFPSANICLYEGLNSPVQLNSFPLKQWI